MTSTSNRRRRSLSPADKPPLVGDRMTRGEAAVAVGVHPSTLWRDARQGRRCKNGERVYLRALDFGGALYFSREDLIRFGEECAEANRRTPKDN